MCTIIRVKRKITEDPADCLIIECKRNKLINGLEKLTESQKDNQTNETSSKKENIPKSVLGSINQNDLNEDNIANPSVNKPSIKEVLKYAGSAQTDDEISARIIEFKSKIDKTVLAGITRGRKSSISSKLRKKTNGESIDDKPKKDTKSFNYVLVNKKRGLDNTFSEVKESLLIQKTVEVSKEEINQDECVINGKKLKGLDIENVNIIDIISSEYDVVQAQKNSEPVKESPNKITCNGVEMIREKISPVKKIQQNQDDQFVYDIYFTKNIDLHLDLLSSNNYEIKSSNNYEDIELVNENDFGEDEDELVNEEDEDSNDEANWRNDYPDEDEYYDDDIDDENDEDGRSYNHIRRSNYNDDEEYDDNYNEYDYEYSDNDDEKKLSRFMKKSCVLEDRSFYEEESENDDFDEYKNDDDVPKSYSTYKKKLLKEIKNKHK